MSWDCMGVHLENGSRVRTSEKGIDHTRLHGTKSRLVSSIRVHGGR